MWTSWSHTTDILIVLRHSCWNGLTSISSKTFLYQKKICLEMLLYPHDGAFSWHQNQWLFWFQNFPQHLTGLGNKFLISPKWTYMYNLAMVCSICPFKVFFILLMELIKSHYQKCSIEILKLKINLCMNNDNGPAQTSKIKICIFLCSFRSTQNYYFCKISWITLFA